MIRGKSIIMPFIGSKRIKKVKHPKLGAKVWYVISNNEVTYYEQLW